jgi:MFS transporter, putative metabolite:H+ symporter
MDLTEKKISIFSLPVIVAALGYFVDIYDLLLFTIVKKTSMLGVGSTEATLLVDSTRVINWQMTGLLLGGIIWGVLADKKGRLSVLFGSIILYSTANFATGFVTTVDQYAWARFIGGLGLAGELGAGITLVSELLPKNKRGVGTSLVAGIGLFGAVAAYYTYQYLCYKIGGVLGICLLLLRVKVAESGMFATAKASEVVKGNFFMLLNNGKRFKKYFVAILIGLPTWYVIGILLNQSDRFGKAMFNSTTIDSGRAIMFGYVGIAVGDILIGLVSQYFKSRKKALLLFYGLTMLGLLFYYSNYNNSDTTMYLVAGWLGFSTGFWAIFVTMGAEQFGTNLRATAATTIPNMVRGALPLMNMLFLDLFQKSWHWSIVYSGIVTGIIVMCVAFTAYAFTEETFHKDLDYMELD